MGKKVGYTVFTVLILFFCTVPSVGMLLPKEEATVGGNQVVAAAPSLQTPEGELNKAYVSQLLDYVEDHHYLHQEMITAWSALNVKALKTSITKDVVLGKNNWLYYGETLADYTGTARMSEGELCAAARNLSLLAEYCKKSGMQFLFTIAPNKNSLYPENMPNLTRHPGIGNAEALASVLEKEDVPYLDLFQTFREQNETLYFTQDSHWNSKGAALAADAINAAFGRKSTYFSGPFIPIDDHRSDLYDMLYPTGPDSETDPRYGGSLDFTYDVPIRSAENLTIMTTGAGTGSLYMFRDSFGNLLYPYLADSCEHTLFSRSVEFDMNRVTAQEADMVVIELVERNLDYLIQNAPAMPAPERDVTITDAKILDEISFESTPAEPLEGCVSISGKLPISPDAGSPVCLRTESPDGTFHAYEVFQLEDGKFAVQCPDVTGAASMVYAVNGQMVSVPMHQASGSAVTSGS